ncbi:hypothetical protein NSQ54_12625 [Alkalihalobacillus sp. FSL W8-0930]
MERIHVCEELRKPLTEFDSSAFLTRICRTTSETRIGLIQLETNGIIGSHQAIVHQEVALLKALEKNFRYKLAMPFSGNLESGTKHVQHLV